MVAPSGRHLTLRVRARGLDHVRVRVLIQNRALFLGARATRSSFHRPLRPVDAFEIALAPVSGPGDRFSCALVTIVPAGGIFDFQNR